jgi:hypothetical protein
MFDLAGMQITFFDPIFAGFVLAELPRLFNKRTVKLPKLPSFLLVTISITLFLALYLVLPLAAILFSDWGPSVLTPGLRMAQWISYGVFAGILYHRQRLTETDLLKLASAVIIIQTAYAGLQQLEFVGLLTLPHHSYFADRNTWFIWGRSTGLFVNPNRYGILMAVLIPLPLIASLRDQNRIRWEILVIAVVGLVGLMMSGSRTGMLMAIAGISLYGLKATRTHPASLAGVILLLSPFVVIIDSITDGKISSRFGQILSVLSGDFDSSGSLVARFEFWESAISYAVTDGPSIVHRAYVSEIDHAVDNVFITLFVQAGIIGPVIYGLLLVGIVVFTHRTALIDTDSIIPRFASLIVIMVAIGSTLAEVIAYPYVSMILWIVTGVAISRYIMLSSLENPVTA